MREEDIAARIGVAKYALVLPMTGKQEAEIVINRVRESINRLVFNTGKEKIRVNFVAGYTSPELTEDKEFRDILEQADEALQKAINSSTEQVVCFDKKEVEIEKTPDIITEQDIQQAFIHILQGDYYQIPVQHLTAVVECLSPFMQYVDNQKEPELLNCATETVSSYNA
jgi:two-component system cell cycle response regulator